MKTGCRLPFPLHYCLLGLVCVTAFATKPASPGIGVKDLVQKAISAHGYATEKTAKVQSYIVTHDANLTIGGKEVESRLTISIEPPDRRHMKLQFDNEGEEVTVLSIYDGKSGKGWNSYNGKTTEMSMAELEETKHSVHASSLISLVPLLDSTLYQLSPAGRVEVEGSPALGVKVSRKGFREAVLFIDEKTFHVVKLLYVFKNVHAGGEPELLEIFFSDFKKEDGLTTPSSFKAIHGGKTIAYGKTVEMIVSEETLRVNTFAKP
jgi:outer membrane lipoprotein-sorting protein